MRSSFVHHGGVGLTRTPNVRERASRRRIAVALGVVALALGSGVIGAFSNPARQATGKVFTSPLSYISVQ